jgi:CHAD domain-containing protein
MIRKGTMKRNFFRAANGGHSDFVHLVVSPHPGTIKEKDMANPVAPGNENESSPDAKAAALKSGEKIGLAAWMDRVTAELDRTQRDFSPEAVHDLRVALRRCLSIAELHIALDPLDDWGEMRREGRSLFKALGELRDTQVMLKWIVHLVGSQDPAGIQLAAHLGGRETKLRERAGRALSSFNRKKWARWEDRLSRTSMPAPLEDPVFQQFALERWQTAHDLHRQALRNRSLTAFHKLRIGLKRFRYTVENFLPQRHELWGKDIKLLQDALGDFHDLFLLWRMALHLGLLADRHLRAQWHARIEEESRIRLQTYREKAMGKQSVWPVWRAGLPVDRELEQAAVARMRIWASYRDRDFARTLDVADLAMQLFDGLQRERIIAPAGITDARPALYAAAIMRNIGMAGGGKKHGKSSYKRIRNSEAPLGISAETYELAALAARYPHGADTGPEAKPLARLPEERKQTVRLVAAILCLADAFACGDDSSIQHLEVSRMTDAILISAAGYREESFLARKLATARYPLEVVCQAPVLIRPLNE